MRAFSVFKKCLIEQFRDWWSLVLSLTTASFFVLLYWSFTGGGSSTYAVLILDHDKPVALPDGTELDVGDAVIEGMRELSYADGQPMLDVTLIEDREAGIAQIQNRDALVMFELPEGLSAAAAGGERVDAKITGDVTHPMYVVAAVFATGTLDEVVAEISGQRTAVGLEEEALGDSAGRTEFEAYVPGLLIVAIVLVLFTAAMAVAREVEAGTLRRLKLTRMTALDYLAGVSAAQVLIAVSSLLVTFGVAWALGFRSEGPLWAAVLVGAVTSFAVIGVGLIVACFARTVSRAFLVANLPFILLMFFSGSIYPIPKIPIFEVGTRTIGLWDILPPTHAVVAMNKILSLGAGIDEVLFELAFLLALSLVYFAAGVWLFHRTHLQAE